MSNALSRGWPLLIAIAIMGGYVHSLYAVTVSVKLKDGREMTGDLVSETDTEIVLTIEGIRYTVVKDQISEQSRVLSVKEEYEARRATVKDDDFDGRYDLAKWLFYDKKAYSLAKQELQSMDKQFPDNSLVALLLRAVEERSKLMGEDPVVLDRPVRPDRPVPVVAPPKARPVPPKGVAAGGRDNMLTEEQINVLKVYELSLASQPRVMIRRDVLQDFLKRYSDHPDLPKHRDFARQLASAQGWQQLEAFFVAKARDLYPKVKVVDDPEVFKAFRTIQQRYILNGCATTECHGNAEADFVLFNNRVGAQADQQVYSNFYILDSYQDAQGFMIDREKPDRSYLIHYGLDRALTRTPHPDAPGWKPTFRSIDDGRISDIIAWINTLSRPRPEYGLDYVIPGKPRPKNLYQPSADNADGAASPAAVPAVVPGVAGGSGAAVQ